MAWILLVLAAIAGAALGGGVTFGAMLAREKIVVDGAVRTERNAGIQTCNVRVGEIERIHNSEIEKARSEVKAAVEAIEATPDTTDEIRKLCDRSASCRERGRP